MADYHKPDFSDRATRAAEAKKALLEKFKSKPPLDEAAVAARRVAAEVRAQRDAERSAARAAAKIRQEEERIAKAAAAVESAERAKREAEERLIAQKVARDAKYAARKARK